MRIRVAGRWVMALLVGLAMLATAGCFGGNRNFSGSADAAGSSGTRAADGQSSGFGPKVGSPAPDLALKDLEGVTVRLSDLRGKAVLVNFWATWCPPCREEMPDLEKAYQKYRSQGYVFLGVDMKEDAATVKDFVQKNRYSWTFLLDGTGQAASSYMVSAIPTTFFVDREGILRDMQIGPMHSSVLEAKLGKIK